MTVGLFPLLVRGSANADLLERGIDNHHRLPNPAGSPAGKGRCYQAANMKRVVRSGPPLFRHAALERAEVLLIDVTAKLVSLLFVAFSWSRISLRSLCASSWPRSLAHSRSEP